MQPNRCRYESTHASPVWYDAYCKAISASRVRMLSCLSYHACSMDRISATQERAKANSPVVLTLLWSLLLCLQNPNLRAHSIYQLSQGFQFPSVHTGAQPTYPVLPLKPQQQEWCSTTSLSPPNVSMMHAEQARPTVLHAANAIVTHAIAIVASLSAVDPASDPLPMQSAPRTYFGCCTTMPLLCYGTQLCALEHVLSWRLPKGMVNKVDQIQCPS
jgi:hypothetical protein